MPHFAHRENLQPAKTATAGWQVLDLMNDEISAKLDAGLKLSQLAPQASTPRHYHSNCEHYMFVIKGQGELILDESVHPIAQGYMIAIEREEWHAVSNVGKDELEYLEFFVPGRNVRTITHEQS